MKHPSGTRRQLLQWLSTVGAGLAAPAWLAAQPLAARQAALQQAAAPGGGPWWQAGRPSPLALQAWALLADAAAQGLEPADYGAEALGRALQAAQSGPPLDDVATARLAAALDASLRRYVSALHQGRIDGVALYKHAGGDWSRPASPVDALLAPLYGRTGGPVSPPAAPALTASAMAASALAASTLAELPKAAWPALPDYADLQATLAPLRALAGHPAWSAPLPPVARPRPGEAPGAVTGDDWPGWPRVMARLQALGDLAAGHDSFAAAGARAASAGAGVGASASASASASAGALDRPPAHEAPALAEALRQFQLRHGLTADAVLGPATRAALDLSPGQRAAQVALTLERLRWRPQPATAPRWLEVNLAAFHVRLVERIDGRPVACGTVPVIVGQAAGHATPLMVAEVQAIEFNPFWNVPPSIARQELVPQLRREPGVAARLGYEAVLANGQTANAADPAVLAAVLAGQARLRQRPGVRNALGSIKFVLPNPDHIYLHHTPAVGLFDQARRDFSHGCVRVQDPVAVALFLLRDQPDWTADRVRAAMAGGVSSSLRLAWPVPILITHETAFVADGRLNFRADLYSQDAALAARLRQRTPGRPGAA